MTTPRSRTRNIVIVKWVDAKVFCDPTDNFDLPTMTSVGFLIGKSKEKILLCNLRNEDDEPRIVTAIPSSLVRNVKRLK